MDRRILLAMLLGVAVAVANFLVYSPPVPDVRMDLSNRMGVAFAELKIKPARICSITISTDLGEENIVVASYNRKMILMPLNVPVGKSEVRLRYSCTTIMDVPTPREECEGDRDYKYFCTALMEKNTTYCNYISDDREYYHCLAYITGNSLWCLAIDENYWRSWCIADCVRNGICPATSCKYAGGDFHSVCEGNCDRVSEDLAKRYCEVNGSW